MDELEALIILTSLPYLGSIKIRLLIAYSGSAVAALKLTAQELADLPGFGPKVLKGWQEGLECANWRHNMALVEQGQVKLVSYTHSHYPKRLHDLPNLPLLLYVKGEWRACDERCIAVVGTRQPSLYGLEMTQKLSYELARAGFTVVSGLARGIDTAAHRGALQAGRTAAVLGSGLACLYPTENTALAEEISGKGSVITEFAMTTPPDRTHFPQRNRLVAAMTMGTLLIEAPLQSGAMITVDKALSRGRPVFVLPGRADWEHFRGNHALLKRRDAFLIEGSQDIVSYFGDLFSAGSAPTVRRFQIPLEKEEEALLQCLPNEELSIDEIAQKTAWPVHKLHVLLMSLSLKKAIREYPGKIYKRIE